MFNPGLVHTPVTPFKGNQSIDYETFAKVLEFHLCNGADALALPMPEGEDLSLTDPEQRKLLEFAIAQVRGRGLWIGFVLDTKARPYCVALMNEGILCKETHENVIRFAPPLVITREEIDWACERIEKVVYSIH